MTKRVTSKCQAGLIVASESWRAFVSSVNFWVFFLSLQFTPRLSLESCRVLLWQLQASGTNLAAPFVTLINDPVWVSPMRSIAHTAAAGVLTSNDRRLLSQRHFHAVLTSKPGCYARRALCCLHSFPSTQWWPAVCAFHGSWSIKLEVT